MVSIKVENKALFSAVISLFLIAGCAANAGSISEYDDSSGRTLYQTATTTVAQGATDSFASASSITMQAMASCDGRGCTPERASIVFSVEGSSKLTLSNRTLTISFDGEEKSWENRTSGRRRNTQIGRTEGRLAKVVMPISDLEEISSASSLAGSLGEKSLNLGSAQSELQRFVASIRER